MDRKQLHVLLVEDDSGDACLTRRALNQISDPHYAVDVATSLAEAEGRLRSAVYDIVLLDLGLPESVGIETVAKFRERSPQPLPIIVLTNLDDQEAALESLDKGAQDYMVKGHISPDTLSRSIRHAMQRQQLLEQLQTANELLQQRSERLTELYNTAQQFVDNVSHEFRTPLTVIREFTSIIRDGYDGPVSPKQIEHLDKVLHRTDDLALMVDDMLDTSKLETGLLGVWRRPCSVPDLVANTIGQVKARAESHNVRLSNACTPALPQVFCDEEKAQRVLINLAVNAIKFTPAGGTVELWARLGDDPAEVVVGVTDSGPGISPENLEIIFERFKQVDANLRSSTKGFGLGLNIAKELVHLNLGQMHVESRVGAGSTFSFTLPLNDPAIVFDRFTQRIDARQEAGAWISLMVASLGAESKESVAPVVDEFLQRSVRAQDLVIQADPRRWIVAAACPEREVPNLIERLQQGWQDYARNCPQAELPQLFMLHDHTFSRDCDHERLRKEFDALLGNRIHKKVGGTVLVVDDDREVNSCLGVRLQAAGYEVLSAFDGNEGLSAAIEHHPDAVVLDVRMPGKDGMAVLRELRHRQDTRKTPVVMLSANVRDQHSALEAGANFWVSKPYEPKAVLSAIESSISERSLA